MNRKELVYTHKARLLLTATYFLMGVLLLLGAAPLVYASQNGFSYGFIAVAIFIAIIPHVCTIFLGLLSWVSWIFIVRPRQMKMVKESKSIFQKFPGTIIAVAGSYGKTTVKELLKTVLSEGLSVVATEGNMNTPVAHARFAKSLRTQDIAILEYGEGAPGDIGRFAEVTAPDYAIITGLAPNHLDEYKTLDALASDMLSIKKHVPRKKLYITAQSPTLTQYLSGDEMMYGISGVDGWNITDIAVTTTGVEFRMNKGSKTMNLRSGLLGRHQIAPLAVVAVIGLKNGLTIKQVEAGIRKTVAFKHRMAPYTLMDATVIDDTYNGNVEGMVAGLELLKELPASRKVYVTPGLVEQGSETVSVHKKIAEKIVETAPDVVVLMKNSATAIIESQIQAAGATFKIIIQDDPLDFYQNLSHFVAQGDLVLLQNDWTDNYN